jgi:2-polyprenyl-6-methoxyphenol hydroxylase-like FAD-dependent oxidoreductase
VRIVVAGGSAAGLFTTLLLGRSGHDVLLLDRDELQPAADVETAAGNAFRAAAPQLVHPHGILPLCRELVRERLPDVYDELLAVGVLEAPLQTQLPPTLADREPRPGDQRITMLLGRRSTIDLVLLRAALAQPGVEVRPGTQVTGLLTEPGNPPHVVGVQTKAGPIPADLVVDASGRRSPVDSWLQEAGARPASLDRAECGLAYYTRHFRMVGPLPGLPTTRILANLDELTVGIWCADNGHALLALAPLSEDKRFRAVTDPDVHTRVLRTFPVYSSWLDALEPVSGVYAMAGLHNTLRRLVVDGAPVVTGLASVGDAVCTTNPTLGRGLSLAIRGAIDLHDALKDHGEDWTALALALDDAVTEHVEPFYRDQVATDGARLVQLRHKILGGPPPSLPTAENRVDVMTLRNAAAWDGTSLRAFWKVMGMLDRPENIYTNPSVVQHTRAVIAEHGNAPAMPQPTTEQLEAALAG